MQKKYIQMVEEFIQGEQKVDGQYIQMNNSFRRMMGLCIQGIINGEPILLIGETGCGKTTVCQLLSRLRGQQMRVINCHKYTESADFIGSLRPVRNKNQVKERLEGLRVD